VIKVLEVKNEVHWVLKFHSLYLGVLILTHSKVLLQYAAAKRLVNYFPCQIWLHNIPDKIKSELFQKTPIPCICCGYVVRKDRGASIFVHEYHSQIVNRKSR
jgi:hypothetical protein